MSYEAILFDFNGVLCQDLYSNLKDAYPSVHNFIETHVFSKNSDIPDKWMRAEMNMDDVNEFISGNTGIDHDILSRLFLESVKDMKLDQRLLDVASGFARDGKKVGIVTDNMDVFTSVTVGHHALETIFPVIVNSFDYRMMKKDQRSHLYDVALKEMGVCTYENVLLIDDSERSIFESKGGSTYPYKTFEAFADWMRVQAL